MTRTAINANNAINAINAINDNNALTPVNIGLTIVEPTAPAHTAQAPPVPHVHVHTAIEIEHIEDEIDGYIDKINTDIGFYWWKRYIYSAFWSNVSTPINLSIIILTALTTGENATKNLIGQEIATILGIAVLFVSIFNTFFRPNEQLAQNQKIMSDWNTMGGQFDEIYYDRVYTVSEKAARLKSLEKLFKSLSVLKRTNDTNYLIDLIFLVIRFLCIRKNIKWILITDNVSVGREKRLTLTMRRQSNYVGMNETHV
jgi:hypothetical protein